MAPWVVHIAIALRGCVVRRLAAWMPNLAGWLQVMSFRLYWSWQQSPKERMLLTRSVSSRLTAAIATTSFAFGAG